MAFAVKSTLQIVESYLKASGYFESATVGEPKGPPVDGPKLTAAVFMSRAGVVSTTLVSTIEQHVIMVRVYRNMLAEPISDIEFQLADVISQIADDLIGEFDLGASVRNVDFAGQHGQSMGTDWGYTEIGGKLFRIVDLTIPLIVDGSATFAP